MPAKPRIALFDITPLERKYFQKKLGQQFDLEFYSQPLNEDTARLAQNISMVSVYVTSQVSSKVIKSLPQLKLVACRSTGYDNVDLPAAKNHNVAVANVPGYGENTVAEYAFTLMLALSRKLLPALSQAQAGQLDHSLLTGFDLAGKTLGVIGTGAIGRHVVRIAGGFAMKVVAYDPYPNPQLEYENNMSYTNLPQLLEQADIVTLHAPFTKDNYHLIGPKAFAKMKPHAILINTARGELVDTQALIAVLASGKLAGAGLDVLEGESILQLSEETQLLAHPLAKDCNYGLEELILEKMPNVILSPHNAFNSNEALERIRRVSMENIQNFATGNSQNIVA